MKFFHMFIFHIFLAEFVLIRKQNLYFTFFLYKNNNFKYFSFLLKIFVLYKSLFLSCVILKCSFVVTYYILNTWTNPFSQLDPNNNLTPNNYKMYECMKDLT